ncbi:MAG: ubiquinol-cytochrome C chaperone [Rhodopseudomonas sp.]|nr:ubiquinol-cytochrome C chaperone [Rhodopseudomonas sp.]
MVFSLFRRDQRPDTISTLYGMIVAQARLPSFYRDFAVADTINGRFDLVLLHLALVLDRLTVDGRLESPGQALFDRFCQDMDDNLREMGISDLKVPKEMRRMGEAFYGRSQAYAAALSAGDDRALIEALSRNVYGGAPVDPALVARLAAYTRDAVRELRGQELAGIAAGQLRFPVPAAAAA